MATQLKDSIGAVMVDELAAALVRAWPAFPLQDFRRKALHGLQALELMDRGRHIARALATTLPPSFDEAADVLQATMRPPLHKTEGNAMAPFFHLPHSAWVAEHGLAHFDRAMAFQAALTQRFTAEFCIRPFLDADLQRTLAVLRTWTAHPSEHVRRLCSEGTRPRLPWGARVPALTRDPLLAQPILDALKDDPSPYVRRSVANHLNDVGYAHPAHLLSVADAWLRGAGTERKALVRHALRTLIKKGHPGALALLGVRASRTLEAEGTLTPRRARVGGTVRVEVTVHNRGKKAADVVADVVVHYARPSGKPAVRVFKGASARVEGGDTLVFVETLRLHDMTTRKHHPGRHDVAVRLNGADTPVGSFVLVA